MNNMILPINDKEFTGVHPEHVFLNAICTSEEKIGLQLVEADVNLANHEWCQKTNNSTWEKNGNNLKVEKGKKSQNMIGYLYRKLKQTDEMIVHINSMQYTYPWASIGIFIADEDLMDSLSFEKENCNADINFQYGYFISNGTYFYRGLEMQNYKKYYWKDYPVSLKMMVYCGEVSMSVRGSEGKWLNFGDDIFLSQSDLVWGIFYNFDEVQWYNWYYVNYLQMCMDKDAYIIDYCHNVRKNDRHNVLNHFIDYHYVEWEPMEELGCTLRGFIKTSLGNKRYVKLVEDDKTDGQALIYGYDDGKECFHAIARDEQGIWGSLEVYYKKIDEERWHGRLVLMEYKQNGNGYYFNADWLIQSIRSQLESRNGRSDLELFLPDKGEVVYGLDVYGEIMANPDVIQILQYNHNIDMLLEHWDVLDGLAKHLAGKGYIDGDGMNWLSRKINEGMDNVRDIKNMVNPEARGGVKADEVVHKLGEGVEIEKKILEYFVREEKGLIAH